MHACHKKKQKKNSGPENINFYYSCDTVLIIVCIFPIMCFTIAIQLLLKVLSGDSAGIK